MSPKNLEPGTSQFKMFFSGISKDYLYQYDYRHTSGELFSTVKRTLEACISAKDKWLGKKAA